MKNVSLIFTIMFLASASSCKAQSQYPVATSVTAPVDSKQIYQGSDSVWGFDFIDKNRIIFTERSGAIKILDVSAGKAQTILNVPKSEQHGQGGMLDVVLHPDFAKNKWVYFSYAVKEGEGYETRISRAKLENGKFQDLEILFTGNTKSSKGEHFGSRIVFDRKGFIFFSAGDRGHREYAQDLTKSGGKIFRLTEDGKIPSDNPFVDKKDALPSIWSYGQRNPQGLYYDVKTDTLWESEHGPKGGDEINMIVRGKNYGWPTITYGREYYGPKIGTSHKDGMEQPIYYFLPSIAPSGLTMHRGALYSGALVLTHLNRVTIKDKKFVKEERLLEKLQERIRNVRSGPDDHLYISTDSGKIIQLKL